MYQSWCNEYWHRRSIRIAKKTLTEAQFDFLYKEKTIILSNVHSKTENHRKTKHDLRVRFKLDEDKKIYKLKFENRKDWQCAMKRIANILWKHNTTSCLPIYRSKDCVEIRMTKRVRSNSKDPYTEHMNGIYHSEKYRIPLGLKKFKGNKYRATVLNYFHYLCH